MGMKMLLEVCLLLHLKYRVLFSQFFFPESSG
jgi:hypothetical protein